jgi:hypothetical protein
LASSPCAFLAALGGSVELWPRRLCRPRCTGRLALLLETDTSFHDVSFKIMYWKVLFVVRLNVFEPYVDHRPVSDLLMIPSVVRNF